MLGIDWLQATNPSIYWKKCTLKVDFGKHGGTHVLHALPTKPVARVELCNINVVQGGFQRAALLSLAAHPEHELESEHRQLPVVFLVFFLCLVFGLFADFVLGPSLPLV